MARADPMTIASGAQTQNKDRESKILVALGDRIVQSFVNAYAARTDALSWRTFASWHAATGRSKRGALPIGNPIAPGPPPASHGRRTVSARNPKELGLAGGRAESLGVERSVDGPAKPGVRRDDGLAYLGSGQARRSPVRRAIVEPCSAALNHLAQRASV
jgi:hypothetical protein